MSDDYVKHEPVTPHSYTHVDVDVVMCNDCGAFAETEEDVQHYPSCHPGESAYWQKYYEQDDWDDEQTRQAEMEEGRWDDDPNPYEGTYSEE